MEKFNYNYNSYTSKPNVIKYTPFININYKKEENELIEKEKNSNIKTISIEEYAEYIVIEKEKARGFKYSSKERRTLKRHIINDIKKGKIKIN